MNWNIWNMLLIKFHFTSRPVYILTRNGNEEERKKLNLKRTKGQKWQHGHFKSCLHLSNKSTPLIPVMKTDSLSPFNPKTVQSFSLSKIIADTSTLSLSSQNLGFFFSSNAFKTLKIRARIQKICQLLLSYLF